MPLIIDAHQDLAYNMLTLQRDYRRSADETRAAEENRPDIFSRAGKTLLGWPDYQRGQVGLIIATIFTMSEKHSSGEWDQIVYHDFREARQQHRQQMDIYRRLAQENSDMFTLVRTQSDLRSVLAPWQQSPADYPQTTHPVGLVVSMEGAEGMEHPDELYEWWQAGLRIIGPVWAGGRYCGGTMESGEFTQEGGALLNNMAEIGFPLDIAHMNERSARQALDRFPGTVIASHGNARALIKEDPHQRQFSDEVLQHLIQRDGIAGMIPYNGFLDSSWKKGENRQRITLQHVVAHIDHICQMAGNSRHVGIGTDFDGGFGWPDVPLELDTIADLQQLAAFLTEKGYTDTDINAIFYGNWQRFLESILPE
ncbi:MAG: membrane dipeptidase [Anaerolineaceae bacterium]|jgi:membrane dipeptidase|nr:membrane dipeptidase [Anaerolineaceae bacterium]